MRLTNYASGLCMPEIAALAGLERLDMMLNDSMYGILFRDINPIRTFVDQRFCRQVHARAGIIINTGEDNYLTTADAVEAAHTVTVSQLLNEYFAKEAGLEDWQLGLGHAFEINPELPDSFRLELAHALLARQLFPDAPLKWMPPTKHMTGDVFRGYLLDGFFNLVGAMTGQGILLVGMMTEAVVTPWLSDRDLALQNVRYVLNAAGGLTEDFHPPRDGLIQTRARQVLGEAVDLLDAIVSDTTTRGTAHPQPLLAAIADGTFGSMKRPPTKGKGLDGVVVKADGYDNPATTPARGRGHPMTAAPATARPDRAPLRRHDRRRHGADVVHAAGAARQARRGRRAAARREDGARARAARPRQGDGAATFTFFVVYGSLTHLVDAARRRGGRARVPAAHLARRSTPRSRSGCGRKLVVVGACIGTDAHTVGIDAILNIKGFAGEKGLEYYREMTVVNLGAQVLVPDLVNTAREVRADAVLVSQVVTQKDAHIHNTTAMSAAFREAFPAGTVAAARRRWSALRGGLRRRARGRPGLRSRDDPRRGRVLPRAPARRRPAPIPTPEEPSDDPCRGRRHRHPPPLRALRPRPLRRQPRRRRLLAGRVRRRRHRAVHPHRRRRGAVRVVLRSCSSSRRCAPGTSSRSRRASCGSDRVRARSSSRCASSVAAPRSAVPPPPTCSTRPWWRPPPAGSWWCPRPGDLPLAGAHPAPVCRAPGCRRRRRAVPLARLPGPDLWWLAPVGVALLAAATLTAGARRGALLGLLGGLAFFVPVLSWSGVYVGALPWFALATLESLYVAAMSAVVGYRRYAG